MSQWTIEEWCANQVPADWSMLDQSAVSFLDRLGLSASHPFCHNMSGYYLEGVPRQGPLQSQDHLETAWDVLLILFYRIFPSMLAMAELWLRLFAFIWAPLGVAMLLWERMGTEPSTETTASKVYNSRPMKAVELKTLVVCVITLVSSVVLATDDMYRLEFGTTFGLNMLAMTIALVGWMAQSHRSAFLVVATIGSLGLSGYLLFDLTHGSWTGVHHTFPRFQEGLYFDESNGLAMRVKDLWPESVRNYHPPKATFWMPTGDARTGLPFLLNSVKSPSWIRVWLPIVDDGEVVALDIHFPKGQHNANQPLYLILHGLNGGSQEEYVKDFTNRRDILENATVAVMVARGLMDLPIRGMNLFHGARWTDAHAAASVLRKALAKDQMLAGVGYSMGGIIMANYVSRSGPNCALDVAVSISGGLDMRFETNYSRAQRLWQPILTQELREKFVLGKWGERTRKRLTIQQMKDMMRAYHISEIDETAVVAYNGFRDLEHYVSLLSVMFVEGMFTASLNNWRFIPCSMQKCQLWAIFIWTTINTHQYPVVASQIYLFPYS